jgi:mediator of RNA polymerase II transcription subunit 18
MHELLLYGQVPAARHEQLLNILAGITAMQPQRVVERHALYKPTRTSAPTLVQRGGTQGVQNVQKQAQNQRVTDLHYIHLVKIVEENDFGQRAEAASSMNAVHADDSKPENPWTIQFQDTPEPGKRPASLRYVSMTEVIQGDVQQYMVGFGYRYVHSVSRTVLKLNVSVGI